MRRLPPSHEVLRTDRLPQSAKRGKGVKRAKGGRKRGIVLTGIIEIQKTSREGAEAPRLLLSGYYMFTDYIDCADFKRGILDRIDGMDGIKEG